MNIGQHQATCNCTECTERRIGDALGTAERGADLIDVAREAHRAERELASLTMDGKYTLTFEEGLTVVHALECIARECIKDASNSRNAGMPSVAAFSEQSAREYRALAGKISAEIDPPTLAPVPAATRHVTEAELLAPIFPDRDRVRPDR